MAIPTLIPVAQPVCPDVTKLTAHILSGDCYKGAFFVGFFCYVTIGGITLRSLTQSTHRHCCVEAAFEAALNDARVLSAQAGFVCIFACHRTLTTGSEWNETVVSLTERCQWLVPSNMAYLYPADALRPVPDTCSHEFMTEGTNNQ